MQIADGIVARGRKQLAAAAIVAALSMLVSAAAVGPASARAAELALDDTTREAAKARLAEGVELMKKNDPAAALARFQEAYAVVASAKIFFNLGLAHQALGHKAEALEAYERFVQESKDPNPASVAKANREIAVLRPDVARVTVNCDVAGVAVHIDGASAGVTPLPRPLYLAPGEHALSLALGQKSEGHRLTAKGGEDQTLAITFGAAPPAPAAPIAEAPHSVLTASQPSPPSSPAPSGATLAPVGVSAREAREARGADAGADVPIYRRTWFWGVAGGVLAAGIVTALVIGGSPSYPTATMGAIPAN